ncbi:sugar ABC transporter permease [Subtercola boreus]|uniref:Sugar ABC transporter permease n=2 Tax=Subtercola boreus TaxID=120213 RepID=A0A3E0VU54_9MICO|nr:sugar ABC transporter permease [Subtercola boreus]
MAKRRRRREARAAFLFLLPDGIGLTVFVGIPILLAIGVSLFSVSGFGDYVYVGLKNFQRMGSDTLLWQSVGVTLTMLIVFVPVTFVVALALAMLVKDRFPGVGVVRAIFFLPNVLSLVVIGVLWQFMLVDKQGVLTNLGGIFGLQDVSWLGTPSLALGTLIVISIWFTMGYQMFLFLGGLTDIPNEYMEAAKIDGASAWQRFTKITWPLLAPTSFFVLVVSIVAAVTGVQAFDLVYILTKGGPANATTTVVFYIYQQAFTFGDYGYAAAITTLLVAFLVIVTGAMLLVTRGGRFNADAD